MNKTLLVVAAHPDDEILGCGGTVARLVREGWTAYSLVLGEGATSRDTQRNATDRAEDIKSLQREMNQANKILGVKECFALGFPDNRFDTVPLLDIVKQVEDIKNRTKPSLIFTHFSNDMNIDHSICNRAVLTATRPMPGEIVQEVLAFEVQSSTEWNFPQTFSPNVFYDVSTTLDQKIKAMGFYKSELRSFPHPRSLQGIELNAQTWGMRMGVKSAEAFVCLRSIK